MDGSGGVLVPLPFPHTEHNVIQQNRIYYIQYCIPCAALSKGMDGGGGALMVPFLVSGWLPVAWGRGCLLIGNSGKPLPEGEEGVWKRKLARPPTP